MITGTMVPNTATADAMTSPYRGLTWYTEADAAYFFGRGKEIATISAGLEVARLTLFYGPSGVGKTSVLRAGVIHQLQQQASSRFYRKGRAEVIPIYFSGWQHEPLLGLQQAIQAASEPFTVAAAADKQRRALDDSAALPSTALLQLPAYLRAWSTATKSELLLILDQFEEYFLYHPNESSPGTFAYELVQAINSIDLRVNFMLSLREDALARLDHFKGQIPFLLDNRLSIGHLGRAASEEAIRKPLEQYNKDQDTTVSIEPALIVAVLDQVGIGRVALSKQGSGGRADVGTGEAIEAPYLQLVMTRLWEQTRADHSTTLRQTTLDDLGGAETIVRNYLDNTLAVLDPADQALAATFFDRLVTPSGNKIALALDELAQYGGSARVTVERLLNRLQDHRLLRGVQSPSGVTQYEIFHDVLGPALLDWQARYQKAQEEQARLAAEQVALAAAERRAVEAAERAQLETEARWQAQLRAAAEQRNSRRLRWLLGLIGALLVGALGLAIFALNARKDALNKGNAAATAQAMSAANAAEAEYQKGEAIHQANAAATEQTQAERNAAEAEHQKGEANRQSQIALVRQLAAQSDAAIAINYSRSLLLAVAAAQASQRVTPTLSLAAADTVLHARLERQPGGTLLVSQTAAVRSVVFSADDQWLATGNAKTLRIWQVGAWDAEPIVLRGQAGSVWSVAFSPDRQWLASGYTDNPLRIWRVGVWDAEPTVLRGQAATVRSVAFSPDGQWLASGSDDKMLRIWHVGAWRTEPVILRGHKDYILSVAFSADGRWLASSSLDNTVRIWRVDAWDTEPMVLHAPAAVRSVAFSVDGQWLASGNLDNTVRIWRVGAWDTEPVVLRGHDSYVYSVAFSADGQWLASGSMDNTLRTWRVGHWDAEPVVLHGHEDTVRSVAFSADGQWLASGSDDNTVRVWTMSVAQLVSLACRLGGRNFTLPEWQQYFGTTPYQVTCRQWPVHSSVVEAIIAEGRKLAQKGNIVGATAKFKQALQFNPSLGFEPQLSAQLEWGRGLSSSGSYTQAMTAFAATQAISPTFAITISLSAAEWNGICRDGALAGAALVVLPACERAVALAPGDGDIRDSRGLALALTGDGTGAIADFGFAVQFWNAQRGKETLTAERKAFIAALKAGKRPDEVFDAANLAKLKDE